MLNVLTWYNASMHWFWRLLISFLAVLMPLRLIMQRFSSAFETRYVEVTAFNALWLTAVATLGVFMVCVLVDRLAGPAEPVFCRQCRTHLRDLTEPMCPACGERI